MIPLGRSALTSFKTLGMHILSPSLGQGRSGIRICSAEEARASLPACGVGGAQAFNPPPTVRKGPRPHRGETEPSQTRRCVHPLKNNAPLPLKYVLRSAARACSRPATGAVRCGIVSSVPNQDAATVNDARAVEDSRVFSVSCAGAVGSYVTLRLPGVARRISISKFIPFRHVDDDAAQRSSPEGRSVGG